ncbi:MAG TPA: CBS domain-containing protein [Vicinamibacterales bacterium]|nr:CBS domain-containing protein [Vicinamibacterales bacterium]
MKVSELMTPDPVTVTPDTNLAAAAALMLQADCGILPVVNHGSLCGVVTDRDLFIALGTRNERASSLKIGDVVTGRLYTCSPEDDVESVLETMREHAIRRVPVAGFGGTVLGIVSLNDIVLAVGAKQAVRGGAVIDTLQNICAHHHPAPRIAAA